jgi:hypothetical protein
MEPINFTPLPDFLSCAIVNGREGGSPTALSELPIGIRSALEIAGFRCKEPRALGKNIVRLDCSTAQRSFVRVSFAPKQCGIVYIATSWHKTSVIGLMTRINRLDPEEANVWRRICEEVDAWLRSCPFVDSVRWCRPSDL